MTACSDQTMRLHGLIDDELDAVNALACEAHVMTCEACHAEFLRLGRLRDAVRTPGVAHTAPASLRARIDQSLRDAAAQPARRRPGRAATWVASGGIGAIAASLAIVVLEPTFMDSRVENELVASHVRSLLANHLTDVQTSDKHVVKPWFNGRIDFSPPAPDLADQGFPLAGGRLDYVEGRVVPAIVYHRRLHTINVFVWPAAGHDLTATRTFRREGYSLAEWKHGDLEFWAVSDIDATELRQFQAAFVGRS